MNVTPLAIAGCFRAESPVWGDDRGFFREWFKAPDLSAAGVTFHAQQANLSFSARNVVRGLHYSLADEGQAKTVTCVGGTLVDVLVDIREGSPTFGVVELVELVAEQGTTVYLASGVAHGFCVTSETASLAYLLSSPYNPEKELEINPFDAEIAIPWPLTGEALVSPKDAAAPTLATRRDAGELPVFQPSSSL